MMEWWAAASAARKMMTVVVGVLTASVTVVAATVDRLDVRDQIEALHGADAALAATDSLILEQLRDIRLNTCLTLVEVRGEPTADRCRR